MTEPDSPDLSSHAPLLERLRAQAFLPGVHYAQQAQAWMHEAADEIELLRATVAALQDQYDRRAELHHTATDACNDNIRMIIALTTERDQARAWGEQMRESWITHADFMTGYTVTMARNDRRAPWETETHPDKGGNPAWEKS